MPFVLAKLFRKKTILKSTLLKHDDFDTISKGTFGAANICLLKTVDVNNALSQQIASINSLYLKPEQVEIIPNGVDLPQIENISKDFDAPLFIYVGAIVERKRPDLAIKFFIKNFAHNAKAKLTLIGPLGDSAVESDSEYVEYCQSLASEHQSQIEFVGNRPPEDVLLYCKKAVSMIFFSENEGMPNVVLEALSYNCVPILGSLDGLAKEIIEDKVSGFIINDSTDVVSLNFIKAISDSAACYQLASRRFSIECVAEQHSKIYKTIASS